MVRENGDLPVTYKENLLGGRGLVKFDSIIDQSEMNGKGRLFSKITLEPGRSIGYHTHENETEIYYILKGTAKYNDNGNEIILSAGDAAVNPSGFSHSLENIGDDDLEFIAVILFS